MEENLSTGSVMNRVVECSIEDKRKDPKSTAKVILLVQYCLNVKGASTHITVSTVTSKVSHVDIVPDMFEMTMAYCRVCQNTVSHHGPRLTL